MYGQVEEWEFCSPTVKSHWRVPLVPSLVLLDRVRQRFTLARHFSAPLFLRLIHKVVYWVSAVRIDLEESVRSPDMPPKWLLPSACDWLLDFTAVLWTDVLHLELQGFGFSEYFHVKLLVGASGGFPRQLGAYPLLKCSQRGLAWEVRGIIKEDDQGE